MRQEKQKKGEERKRKVKVKTAVSLLNPKIFLSAHARTSQANSLHLDQKAVKLRPVNGFVVSFSSL